MLFRNKSWNIIFPKDKKFGKDREIRYIQKTVYENEDEEYVAFCTPECASAIDSYLEYRQRPSERPLKEDSPLIREKFDINDEIIATRPKSLRPQTFQRMVNIAGFRSGVGSLKISLSQSIKN